MHNDCARQADLLKRQLDRLGELERTRDYVVKHLPDLKISVTIKSDDELRTPRFTFDHPTLPEIVRSSLTEFITKLADDQREIAEATLACLTDQMKAKPAPATVAD